MYRTCQPANRHATDEDWDTWLGEKPANLEDVKACLKTVDGVRWTMTKEGKRNTVIRGKPVVSDPTGLF